MDLLIWCVETGLGAEECWYEEEWLGKEMLLGVCVCRVMGGDFKAPLGDVNHLSGIPQLTLRFHFLTQSALLLSS